MELGDVGLKIHGVGGLKSFGISFHKDVGSDGGAEGEAPNVPFPVVDAV